MSYPETQPSDTQKRREELQRLDPALTPEFWAGMERDAENAWWDRSVITFEEYLEIVHGDENEKL